VIVPLAASSAAEVPRGLDFLLSRNRLNVAVSRAQWATFVVHSPRWPPPAQPARAARRRCLACFLRRVLERQPCTGRLSLTHDWQWAQRRRGLRTGGLTAHLKRNGGWCDSEVLLDVYPDDEVAVGERCPHPARRW
jgi:hypothetical protein